MAIAAVRPANEAERLEALLSYEVLDTPPEQEIDDLVHIASQICGTPISMVSLIDSDRQWFKAKCGPVPFRETPRDISFCGHAILSSDLFIVADARLDARFADNPLVTGEFAGDPKVCFYAAAPLLDHDGLALGTLCVVDTQREFWQRASAKRCGLWRGSGEPVRTPPHCNAACRFLAR